MAERQSLQIGWAGSLSEVATSEYKPREMKWVKEEFTESSMISKTKLELPG